MKYDIITFGSAVVDIYMDTSVRESKGQLCFDVGDKILIDDINFSIGGGGTNTAVAFRRLGLKAGYFGKIGEGKNGEIVLRELGKDNVPFLGIKSKEHTAYSAILGAKKGRRTILTYKGASNTIKWGEVEKGKLKADWFYFSSMMEESFKTMEKLVEFAVGKGTKVAFNPSQYQVCLGKNRLKKILKNTDVLILNKKEAGILVGKGNLHEKLHKLGVKIICITEGDKGSETSDGINLYRAHANKNIKCRETTGAGDAFASGFVYGIIKNFGIEKAIQIGSANAESVIQIRGAKNGLLRRSDLGKIRKVKIVEKKEK